MFDYRYHALSLAAVLLALAVGVVIGVAIGDSNLVSSAKSGIVHDLSSEVSAAQHQSGQLRAKLGNSEAFANDLYPIAVRDQLGARNVGLVFLGSASDRIEGLVRDAVTQAGGSLATVVAVREPLDLPGLAREAAGTRYAALGTETSKAGLQLVERFGDLMGRQLVSGGQAIDRELLSRARGPLLSAFDGQLGKLAGVVVVHSQPADMEPAEAQSAAAFESGLIGGLKTVGIPAVGIELTITEPSQVPWYQGHGIASVDDLDETAGATALVYALAGARGAYGVKGTADSLLPNVAGVSPQG